MTIDWFTFGAQFVNFFILLYLLKYFLYGPITRAMDERERRIREQFEEAEEKQEQAEQSRREYEKKQEELADDREDILDEAREEADQTGEELVEKAREEAEQFKERWLRELRQERDQFLEDLRQRAGEAMRDQMERALEDLADCSLERQMIHRFIEQIEGLDPDDREAFLRSVQESGGTFSVDSTCDLAADDRDDVERAVADVFGEDVDVTFEVDEDVVCGIELRTPGRRLGWSLREYLERIEERLASEIDRQTDQNEAHSASDAVTPSGTQHA